MFIKYLELAYNGASLVDQTVTNLPDSAETWALPLGQEDPLEKEMTIHSSILAYQQVHYSFA